VREDVAIKRIESGIVNIGDEHAFAQVVEHNDACTPTQPTKRFLVKFGPDAGTRVEHRFFNSYKGRPKRRTALGPFSLTVYGNFFTAER
jgi:hypothetical protein